MLFFREEVYSSAYWLGWSEGRDFSICLKHHAQLGTVAYCKGAHINSGGRSSL